MYLVTNNHFGHMTKIHADYFQFDSIISLRGERWQKSIPYKKSNDRTNKTVCRIEVSFLDTIMLSFGKLSTFSRSSISSHSRNNKLTMLIHVNED